MLVVLGAADLVGGLAAELADVERVKAHLGVGDRVRDRLFVAGGHVDRDRPDRRLLLRGEPVEERLQAGGVAAFGRPHDRAGLVVGHAREELVIGAIVDLIHADQRQAVQPAGGSFSATTRARMFPTVSQPIRISLVSCVWFICCASHAVSRRSRACTWRRLAPTRPSRADHRSPGSTAAAACTRPSSAAAHIEMPPALGPVILDLQPARAAPRAERLLAAQRDHHDHRLRAELHVADPRARKPEHPVISGGDPHVALLCSR